METVDLLDKYFETAFAAPDGIKRLRELILTLAMQGKLVPQNPQDRPASELLKEIEAEKKRLIKAGNFKKSKITLPKIDLDQIPFKIPSNWQWCYLDDIAVIARGGSPRPIQSFLTNDSSGINWIKIGDTDKDSLFITQTKQKITRDGLSKTRMIYPDDLILSNSMSFGHPFISKVQGCIHDGWLLIRTPEKLIDKIFLCYMFLSGYTKKTFQNAAAGAVVQNLNADKVRELLFPLPPIEEQRRIVEKIDRLMEKIDRLEKLQIERDRKRLIIHAAASDRLLNALDKNSFNDAWNFIQTNFNQLYSVKENISELRKAILQLAVMGKLVPQYPNDPPASELLKEIEAEKQWLIKEGKIKKQKPLPEIKPEEIPYDLPQTWEWVRVIDIVDVGTGSTPATTNSEYYGGDIPWYTSSATNNYIAEKPEVFITQKALDETNCKIFPGGSLIIALYGQGKTRGQISEIIIAGATNQAIAAMIFFESSKDVKQYLKYYFLKMYDEIRSLAEGGAQPNLNVGKIKNTLIPLPPLPEQYRIVAKVDRLMALCDELEAQLTKQTEKQTALLNEVIAAI